jgi:hypothetical protein
VSQEHKLQTVGWGVLLIGHAFDLEDCRDMLKQPFEPWVAECHEGLALRSESFDTAASSSEVHERSKLLMSWLNGALTLCTGGGPIKCGGVVQFKADGTEHRTSFLEAVGLVTGRAKARGFASVLGLDGKPLPPPPPRPSDVQEWMRISEEDDVISDAIVYYSRSDNWFDIWKCLECLVMRFGDKKKGAERSFKGLLWISEDRFDLLARTANHERHARKKFDPPDDPMPKGEAKELLGTLLRRALNEVSASVTRVQA